MFESVGKSEKYSAADELSMAMASYRRGAPIMMGNRDTQSKGNVQAAAGPSVIDAEARSRPMLIPKTKSPFEYTPRGSISSLGTTARFPATEYRFK